MQGRRSGIIMPGQWTRTTRLTSASPSETIWCSMRSWVQDLISNDPSILGLGDLVLRDRERIQPRAGRLDLLLQDPESKRRYEVEIQLGSTDKAHIIRTFE